ncbi:MAG: TIGR03545 family protein [Gammaproteobacteria bacterium]|nr:TIGR03545 family protein [Gammaproteobacteria bacterium]
MKAIRWPGFITFTVLTTMVVAGCLLFAGTITKSILETTLTSINGAKANIDSVKITYNPLGLNINNLQITDPERPLTNSVQITQVRFSISLGDLLLKKIVVDDMAMDGVQIDTPRKSSGAINKEKNSKKTDTDSEKSIADFAVPDIALPDVGDLIKKEQLNSEKLINDLNTDLDSTQSNWKIIRDDLNDKQRWDSFHTRYDKIKADMNGNTAQRVTALNNAKSLTDDLKSEIKKAQQARKQFDEDNNRLSEKFKTAKNAPKDDIKHLKEQYKLNDPNAQNITQLLFGSQAAEYLAIAEKWYKRIKPYIEDSPEEKAEKEAHQRKQGMNVKFREFNPKPDFYIRKASIEALLPRGQFTGSITEISSDQSINKKPMHILLSGKNLPHRDSETISAEFNYINKNKGYSQFDYNIKSYQLEDVSISKSKALSLTMQKGLMSLDLSSRLENARLTGISKIDFNQVQFKTNKESTEKSFSSMMATSFSGINRFNLNARFSGSLHDLNINLQSNLDNQLGDQLKTQLKQRSQQFEDQLKSGIDEKLKAPLARIEDKRQKLDQLKTDVDNLEKELQAKLDDIENRIKQANKSSTEKKKDELQDKLKSKLKR